MGPKLQGFFIPVVQQVVYFALTKVESTMPGIGLPPEYHWNKFLMQGNGLPLRVK